MKDAAGVVTHFVTIKRDITHRRVLEQQASQSQRIEGIGRLALKGLFTSGYSRDAVSQDFGMSDAGFIAKPYGLKELAAAVRSALEG